MRGYDEASYGHGFADVYDDWYHGVSDVDATVATLARLADGGPVLELGVGTGRLAIPLAATGIDVHGVDSSPEMLAQLTAKSGAGRVRVRLGDMAIDLPEATFSLVFAAYNTFWNLLTEENQRTCFAQVAARLSAAGSFVIEASVPDATLHEPPQQVGLRSLSVDRVVLSVTSAHPDAQRTDGQFIEISETGGVRLRPWSVRWVTIEQLDQMAADVGLSCVQRWEAFDGTPFTASSSQHVSVYRRLGS